MMLLTLLRFINVTSFPVILVIAAVFLIVVVMVPVFIAILLADGKTAIHIYSAGFIICCGKKAQVIRWEEVEWVKLDNGTGFIYLNDKKPIVISRYVQHLEALVQEIELKARLARQPEGEGTLERRYEQLLRKVTARQQERDELSQFGQKSLQQEAPEEASIYQREFQLGLLLSTYHAGLKGFWRGKIVGVVVHYTLLLVLGLMLIEVVFHFPSVPGWNFMDANNGFFLLAFFILFVFWISRYTARAVRLHLYTEGFVYIDGSALEVVRWEQIEKIIYHKYTPLYSPAFCHIYLANGDTLTISGYIHERAALAHVLNEHVAQNVQAG
jgi:hypothetical protein